MTTVEDMQRLQELELEDEALNAGVAGYRQRTAKLEARGMLTTTDYGKRLVAASVEPLVEAIRTLGQAFTMTSLRSRTAALTDDRINQVVWRPQD